MTHCPEWEDLFRKRPDACVESADYRRKVERWLNTLEDIRKRGIQVTTKIFPEGAHRVLLTLDEKMREKALNYICHRLERGEKITAPDLKKSIAVWEGKEASKTCPIRKNNTNVLSATPATIPPAACTVPCTCDPDTPPQPSLVAQQAVKECPFQTAAQVKAHDADPLGVHMSATAPKDENGQSVAVITDPVKAARVQMEELAEELLALMPKGTQLIVTDYLRQHPSKKVKDAFYDGIELLGSPPKASSAGAQMRRG